MRKVQNYFFNFVIGLVVLITIGLIWHQPVYAQEEGTISGRVIDAETGNPLVGANVMLKGTNIGSSTDLNGFYEIKNVLPGDYTLSCSFMGYEIVTQQITVIAGEELKVNFSLKPTVLPGQEVVVIGYGVEQKRNLLGAVSSVRIEEVKKTGIANSLTAIQGKAPGVVIEPYSGQPDSDPNIKIRGVGTLNNNNPLYIIDGVPGDIGFVDPEEIKSMDILKDASAAAIYGSRAANGVIIVETKRGAQGQPMNIQFSSSYGIQSLTKKWDVLNAREYCATLLKACEDAKASDPAFVIPNYLLEYKSNPEAFLAANPDFDWQDEYYGSNVPVKKYNLTLSGGGVNNNYSVSGTYYDQKGTASDTWANRWSLRVNSDFTKGKIKIGESVSIGRERNEWVNGDAGGRAPHFQVLAMAPTVSPYATDPADKDGYGGPTVGYSDAAINIIGNNNLRDDIWTNDHLKATGYLEYEVISGLKFKTRANLSVSNSSNYYYAPTYTMGFRSINATADLSDTRGRNVYTVLENFLSYDTQIKKHEIKALAGFSREKNEYRETGASIENFPANYLPVFNAGTENPGVSGYEEVSKLESMFARAFYSYDDKYLMNFTVRRDGSSRFAEDNRYGTFPSFSLGWRMSSESLFKKLPFANSISDMKLRYDWGKLGNQEIGDYQYMPGLTIGSTFGSGINLNYPFGTTTYPGGAITSFPALGLKWEETTTADFGLDLSLFNDKLLLVVDYYKKTTDGILYQTPIPLSTGVPEGPLTNIASMENSGLEFSFDYRDFKGDFNYRVRGNLTTINNEVKKLGTEAEVVWAGAMQWGQFQCTKTVVGGEVGAFYLYETAGLFQTQQEIDSYVVAGKKVQPNAAPGDIKFVDQNGDGVLNSEDKIYMGSAIPDFEYGLNFSGSYKNFDLSLSLHGVQGKKMFNGTKWFMERMVAPYNWDKETLKAWTPTNTNTDVPRVVLNDPNSNERESDRWLENASYLRLSNIQIGYTIPKTIGLGFGAGNVRIYLSADNVFTITPYTGYDPTVTGSDLFERGVDLGIYPTFRTIRTGFEINFQ